MNNLCWKLPLRIPNNELLYQKKRCITNYQKKLRVKLNATIIVRMPRKMCAALINFSTRRHKNTSWQSSDKKFVHFYKKLSIFLHSLIVSTVY